MITSTPLYLVGVVAAALLTTASPAVAQRLLRPPRSVDGLFGGQRPADANRTTQELSLTVDLLGGYDDNIAEASEAAPANPFGPQQSSYLGTASTALRYWRGNVRRSGAMSGQIYTNMYNGLGLGPQVGGNATIDASTNLGERTALTVDGGMTYQPTFLVGAFGAIAGEVEGGVIPGVGGTHGLSAESWLEAQAAASIRRSWTARQGTTVSYSYYDRQPVSGAALQTWGQGGAVQHSWGVGRGTSLDFGYHSRKESSEQMTGPVVPLRTQTLHVGVDFTKRLSRTRTVGFGLGAGATEAQTIAAEVGTTPVTSTSPSFYGSLRADLGRTWTVSGHARRDVTRLQGITSQPFLATAGALNIGGALSGRLNIGVSAAYSKGAARHRETGSYQIFAGVLQMEYGLSGCCGLFSSYSYYRHRILDVAAVLPGFPSAYDRNAVRVGLSILLPLHGTFRAE